MYLRKILSGGFRWRGWCDWETERDGDFLNFDFISLSYTIKLQEFLARATSCRINRGEGRSLRKESKMVL